MGYQRSDVDTSGWENIGEVFVDSGQIMVGDPCYLDQWGGHEFTSHGNAKSGEFTPTGAYSYDGACTATCSKDSVGVLGKGMAAAVSSGYGDGSYGVYVKRENVGMGDRIAAVMVVFCEGESEEEVCENCGGEMWGFTYGDMCPDCEENYTCPECGDAKDETADMCGQCEADAEEDES